MPRFFGAIGLSPAGDCDGVETSGRPMACPECGTMVKRPNKQIPDAVAASQKESGPPGNPSRPLFPEVVDATGLEPVTLCV